MGLDATEKVAELMGLFPLHDSLSTLDIILLIVENSQPIDEIFVEDSGILVASLDFLND